jgi:hypothetical protein
MCGAIPLPPPPPYIRSWSGQKELAFIMTRSNLEFNYQSMQPDLKDGYDLNQYICRLVEIIMYLRFAQMRLYTAIF